MIIDIGEAIHLVLSNYQQNQTLLVKIMKKKLPIEYYSFLCKQCVSCLCISYWCLTTAWATFYHTFTIAREVQCKILQYTFHLLYNLHVSQQVLQANVDSLCWWEALIIFCTAQNVVMYCMVVGKLSIVL